MTAVVPAEGATLDRILDQRWALAAGAFDRRRYGQFHTALMKTAWASGHQRCHALLAGSSLLASADSYDLAGVLDRQPVRVVGIGSVLAEPGSTDGGHAQELVERLVHHATQKGAELVLFFSSGAGDRAPSGFEAISRQDVTLRVTEPTRYGAPMTMVRGGDVRDLAAIVAMGRVGAAAFRFHLDRDVDFIQYAITRKRLLAGLGAVAARQLHFFIAEEGTTAAAYVVISVVGGMWTLEECGDRDPSGARIGALLQALIAREPAERRPTIRACLPAGLVPPQVSIESPTPSTDRVLVAMPESTRQNPRLTGDDVLLWRSDIQ